MEVIMDFIMSDVLVMGASGHDRYIFKKLLNLSNFYIVYNTRFRSNHIRLQ